MPPKTKINLKDRFDNGEIDLSMSDLQEVPIKEIATIKKATSLDLSNNRLTTLGKTFITLTHIIKLDLSKNQLKELPEDFGKMSQLKHLDLYSNEISHLPLSFCELKALRWLDLKNNPIVPALAKVVGPCLDAKQCQESAKATVAFLTEMRESVEEERERMRQQKQRDLELQLEKEKQSKKRNDRKKAARAKKKEYKKLEEEREIHEKENGNIEEMEENSFKPIKKVTKPVKPKNKRFSFLTLFFVAMPILTFLLSASNILGPTGELYRAKLHDNWLKIIQSTPDNIQPYLSNYTEYLVKFHNDTGNLIENISHNENLQKGFETLSNTYTNIQPYLSQFFSYIGVLVQNLFNFLQDLSQNENVQRGFEVLNDVYVVVKNQAIVVFRTLSEKVGVITQEISKKIM